MSRSLLSLVDMTEEENSRTKIKGKMVSGKLFMIADGFSSIATISRTLFPPLLLVLGVTRWLVMYKSGVGLVIIPPSVMYDVSLRCSTVTNVHQ